VSEPTDPAVTRSTPAPGEPPAAGGPDEFKLVATLDGVLVPPTLPMLRPDDLGVLRGDGIFEATVAVDGVVRDLEEHFARMRVSARMVDLDLPETEAWRPAVAAVLAGWTGGREMVLRLIATRGIEAGGPPTCYVIGSALAESAARQRREGIRVLVLDRGFHGPAVAAEPWLLVGAKTISYAINMAGYRYAKAHDADDVIYLDTDGTVLEAPTSTVILAHGRRLVTPPREGILDGITGRRLLRAAAEAGWETSVQPVQPDDLHVADGLWLVSSVRLLTPVVAVDGKPRDNGGLTEELARLLEMPEG
jgi:4-amino-4-deoxychorismate lyase